MLSRVVHIARQGMAQRTDIFYFVQYLFGATKREDSPMLITQPAYLALMD